MLTVQSILLIENRFGIYSLSSLNIRDYKPTLGFINTRTGFRFIGLIRVYFLDLFSCSSILLRNKKRIGEQARAVRVYPALASSPILFLFLKSIEEKENRNQGLFRECILLINPKPILLNCITKNISEIIFSIWFWSLSIIFVLDLLRPLIASAWALSGSPLALTGSVQLLITSSLF